MATSYGYTIYIDNEDNIQEPLDVIRMSGGNINYPNFEYYYTNEQDFPVYNFHASGYSSNKMTFLIYFGLQTLTTWEEWLAPFYKGDVPTSRDIVVTYNFNEEGVINSEKKFEWILRKAYPVSFKMDGFTTKGVATFATMTISLIFSKIELKYKVLQ